MKRPSTNLVGRGLLSALLLFSMASASFPKVFRILGRAFEDQLQNGSLPWDSAYAADMVVNGRKAKLRLYSARFSEPVEEQLKRRFGELGAKVAVNQAADGLAGKAVWPDHREASFFVIAPPDEPRQLVFVYYPEPGDAREEVRFPVPEYPRGKRLLTTCNKATGTCLAILETADSATEVHSFYMDALKGDGWTLLVPPPMRDGALHGMAAFEKKRQVCYVQAADRPGRPNLITLLVKGGSL